MAVGELATGRGGWAPRLVDFPGRDFEGWEARRLVWVRRPATVLAAMLGGFRPRATPGMPPNHCQRVEDRSAGLSQVVSTEGGT